jgi:hypothetical protein
LTIAAQGITCIRQAQRQHEPNTSAVGESQPLCFPTIGIRF